jgi:hypothetical protein
MHTVCELILIVELCRVDISSLPLWRPSRDAAIRCALDYWPGQAVSWTQPATGAEKLPAEMKNNPKSDFVSSPSAQCSIRITVRGLGSKVAEIGHARLWHVGSGSEARARCSARSARHTAQWKSFLFSFQIAGEKICKCNVPCLAVKGSGKGDVWPAFRGFCV